jgi:hypothetical protein
LIKTGVKIPLLSVNTTLLLPVVEVLVLPVLLVAAPPVSAVIALRLTSLAWSAVLVKLIADAGISKAPMRWAVVMLTVAVIPG